MPLSPRRREWRAPWPLNPRLTLGPLQHGRGDPLWRHAEDGTFWRACRTPAGPGTLSMQVERSAGLVRASAWGEGADWLLDTMPALLGADDDPSGFAPDHPLLREALRRHPGLRIARAGRVLEALAPAVLEQKVTGIEARRSWRELLYRFGSPAPGPNPHRLRVPPSATDWTMIPSWEWHRAGVDGKRSRTMIAAARVAPRLEQTLDLPLGDAHARLCALPGIGPWTAAEVMARAHGDADAVPVGDLHLPGLVGAALAGRLVDDAGMLELLEPYRGHRYRAITLILLSGVRVARRAPRFAPRDYRAI